MIDLAPGACRTGAGARPPRRPGEQLPVAREPLELAVAAILECDPRAGDEILHRARNEHLAGLRLRCDARSGVHRDPGDLSVDELTLARVQAGPDLEAELAHGLA